MAPLNANDAADKAYASPLFTDINYADTSTCGGQLPVHCSVAIDESVPYIKLTDDKILYLVMKSVFGHQL